MPIYEYRCAKCDKLFEELVLTSTEKVRCPGCSSPKVVRQMSAFAFKSGSTFVSSAGQSCTGCSANSCGHCGRG